VPQRHPRIAPMFGPVCILRTELGSEERGTQRHRTTRGQQPMGVAGSPSCSAQRRLRSDAAAMSGRVVGILPSRIGRAEDQRLGVDEHLTAGPLTHPAQRDLGSVSSTSPHLRWPSTRSVTWSACTPSPVPSNEIRPSQAFSPPRLKPHRDGNSARSTPRTILRVNAQSDDSARDGAVISKKRSNRALALPQRQNGPGQQVSRNDNAQTSDEGTGDTTYTFPVHLLGELDAPAAEGVEPRDSAAEGPLSRSALLLVIRGPNAGSQVLLDQPVTSAGRHPDSDIFLDDATVSRHHVEFRLENGQFLLVDLDSLNNTFVNHEPVDSAVLVDSDEIQIGKCPGIRCPGARQLLRLRQPVVRLGLAVRPHRVVRPTRAPRTGRNYQRLCRCAGRAGDIP
jgi:hypothetical protein